MPGDLATIYNFTPLFNNKTGGKGQTIAVIEDTDLYSTADWSSFRQSFGLASFSAGSLSEVHPACSDPGDNADDFEAILDAEWASAAAPDAAIMVASCPDSSTFGGLIALENLIDESTPPGIVSISYGECEAFNGVTANAAYSSAYQQAVAEGISVFVAVGDYGAALCDAGYDSADYGIAVSGFASTAYNVAVGGTDFEDSYLGTDASYWSSTNGTNYASAKSYIPEIPWNNSCAGTLLSHFATGSTRTYGTSGYCNSKESVLTGTQTLTAASGGPSLCATGAPSSFGVVSGSCAGTAKPSWQSIYGNPADGVRDLPDVSLFAANGLWGHYYIVCYSNPESGASAPCTGNPSGWSGAGGTSFASPIFAGIQALVNQRAGSLQGNPAPIYYQFASAEYGSAGNGGCVSSRTGGAKSTCAFYDITIGDIDVPCQSSNYCYWPSGIYGVLSTSDTGYMPTFAATRGWDFATGIGSVNVTNLVHAWPANSTSVKRSLVARE